jgi:hypothetical protein
MSVQHATVLGSGGDASRLESAGRLGRRRNREAQTWSIHSCWHFGVCRGKEDIREASVISIEVRSFGC